MRRAVFLFSLASAISLLATPPSSAIAITHPAATALTVTFTPGAPEQNVKFTTKVCFAHAARGWKALLQESEGSAKVWRTISQFVLGSAAGCKTILMSAGGRGVKPFRARLLDGTRVRVQTPVKDLLVYGHVPASTFMSTLFNCSDTGTVDNGSHNYPYVCTFGAGTAQQATGRDTCRSLTMNLVSTDNANGDPSSSGTSTGEIDQATLNPQSTSFGDNAVTSWRVNLDKSIVELKYNNTSYYSQLYILQAGTWADCLSATGA